MGKFLDKLTRFRKFPITDDHADMIEEFLRHGADPFVSRLGPLRNFSLMNVIERMFPPIHSSRLRKVVSQEIDHHRSRALYSRKRVHSQGEGNANRGASSAESWRKSEPRKKMKR